MLAAFSFMPSKKINNNIFIWLFLFYFFSYVVSDGHMGSLEMIWNKGKKITANTIQKQIIQTMKFINLFTELRL